MKGTEESTGTVWEYDPGPGWTGRHAVTEGPTFKPVTWAVVSPELSSPTGNTVTVEDPAAAGRGAAGPATSSSGTNDDRAFPYVMLVVAMLVVVGAIPAVGVFRSWREKRSSPKSVAQQKVEAWQREEEQRYDRAIRREREDRELSNIILGSDDPSWRHDARVTPEQRARLDAIQRRLHRAFAKWVFSSRAGRHADDEEEMTEEQHRARRRRMFGRRS